MKHAKFSPSGSSRWIPCPGSLTLFPPLDENEVPSVYAQEGTVCHEIAATCLKSKESPSKYLGQIVDDISITQELVDAIDMYINEIKNIVRVLGARGGKVEFEVNITDECWGTLDFGTWNADTVAIVDLKMGKGVLVEAEENTQLMLYAVGVLKYLQKESELVPSNIDIYIIQPRTVNPVRKWSTTRKYLLHWFQDVVQPALNRVNKGDTTCVPGEAQCRWCPIAPCEAMQKHLLEDAEGAFSDFVPAAAQGLISVGELAEILPRLSRISQWVKTIKEYALLTALEGTKIPGFKLVEGRSNRKWAADEKDVATFLVSSCKISAYEEKLISPTQAEKAVGKKMAEKVGLDKYITKPPGKPTLVPISDKRIEISESVEEEFQDFIPTPAITAVEDATILAGTPDITAGMFDELNESSGPLVIDKPDDDKDVKKLSAFDRLLAEDDDEIASPKEESEPEIATSGIDTGGNVVMILTSSGTATAPKVGTKRNEVFNMGKGGVSITQAAKTLSCTENMIKMHLRYLNEQNGYNVFVYDTGEFIVKEKNDG